MREGNWIDRSLDPVDRLSEVMFGLLMALTFTGAMSVALAEGREVRGLLFAALGCNLAWGIVDGVMHLLTTAAERGRQQVLLDRLRRAPVAAKPGLVRALLPEGSGQHLTDEEAGWLARMIERAAGGPGRPRLQREDFIAAAAVCVVVVTATFPPVLPFILIQDGQVAMRWSNGIAVLMLFGIGLGLDRYVEGGSRLMRWVVPALGLVLVGTTIALGG
jgi:VIT1/CCC1 family predicted Fe2+/Mn2+ transporter